MNKILNKINYMKGIYEIKKEDIDKDILMIDIYDPELIIEGEIKKNILTHKFKKEGLYQIYIITGYILTDMSYMFSGCSGLKKLNLSSFNTNQVTDMNSMFRGCSGLKDLNLSSFNTNQVKYMSSMFYGCSGLKELNLSSFNTNQVTNMSYMFSGCSGLKELNLSSFNTNQVTDMNSMFSDSIYKNCTIQCNDNNINELIKREKSNCFIF